MSRLVAICDLKEKLVVAASLSFKIVITAGQTEDKPEISARVGWSGTGIDLKTSKPTPIQIRDAVQTILASPSYKQNALRMKMEIQQYNSPVMAVELLEKLAATKQPVLNKYVK